MDTLATLLQSPLGQTIVTGFMSAFVIDIAEFLKSNTAGEFLSKWEFKVAFWRWAKGIVGAVMALGGYSVAQ